MSDKIVIYQKPTCSKCRATLTLLKESGEEFESINYYETLLTIDKLRELINKLNPDLIQRPIVVRGSRARLCRPPENVMELFK